MCLVGLQGFVHHTLRNADIDYYIHGWGGQQIILAEKRFWKQWGGCNSNWWSRQAGFNEEVTLKQRLKGGEGGSPVISWGTAVKGERMASARARRQEHTWHVQGRARRPGGAVGNRKMRSQRRQQPDSEGPSRPL